MVGWVGDDINDLAPHLYADSDFAGDTQSMRSTSGAHLAVEGPNTRFPLIGRSVRQGCISCSTPEAEIVAAAFAIRREGIPAGYVWDRLLRHPKAPMATKDQPIVTEFHEDNQTMIQAAILQKLQSM